MNFIGFILSLFLITGCGQDPIVSAIKECGNKIKLTFQNGNIACATDGDEAINLISKNSFPLTGLIVGTLWPTKETPEHDIDRFWQKVSSSPKFSSLSVTNEIFATKIPLFRLFGEFVKKSDNANFMIASKHYEVQRRENLVVIKKDGNQIKTFDPSVAQNKNHLSTIFNLISGIKNNEEILQGSTLRQAEIKEIIMAISLLEKTLKYTLDFLK